MRGKRPGTVENLLKGNVFHILIVDDDRTEEYLLRQVMKNLRNKPELHFVFDGVEALDFLHGRGAHTNAPRPNLILLDINMPRLGGLETLSAIKNDPELYMIPVIMLSASASPRDVRESYQARANCYVQKPTDLPRSVQLVQAVEVFWMDFALSPPYDPGPTLTQSTDSKGSYSQPSTGGAAGIPIADFPIEARSRAMLDKSPANQTQTSYRKSGCEEHDGLLDEFGEAVQALLALHQQQFVAIVEGDSDCTRFDLLIHMANERKQRAKYAYLRHVEAHGCSKPHEPKQT